MGQWKYPPLDAVTEAVGLEEVDIYVLCLQKIVAQYIVTHMILELYLAEERRLGAWVSIWW